MIFAVLATGPSMSRTVSEAVRDRCAAVAVSDAYRLAPWAGALVSTDAAWWKANPDAFGFPGQKFTAAPEFTQLAGVERFKAETATNSGLLGVMVAVHLGATRVLLCGFDMHSPGDHFFGRHPEPLKSTTSLRMEAFHRQFDRYKPRGVEILNCTPGSALKTYPMADLESALC